MLYMSLDLIGPAILLNGLLRFLEVEDERKNAYIGLFYLKWRGNQKKETKKLPTKTSKTKEKNRKKQKRTKKWKSCFFFIHFLKGWLYVFGLGLTSFISVIYRQKTFTDLQRLGIKLKATYRQLVFRKLMSLDAYKGTAGEVFLSFPLFFSFHCPGCSLSVSFVSFFFFKLVGVQKSSDFSFSFLLTSRV